MTKCETAICQLAVNVYGNELRDRKTGRFFR